MTLQQQYDTVNDMQKYKGQYWQKNCRKYDSRRSLQFLTKSKLKIDLIFKKISFQSDFFLLLTKLYAKIKKNFQIPAQKRIRFHTKCKKKKADQNQTKGRYIYFIQIDTSTQKQQKQYIEHHLELYTKQSTEKNQKNTEKKKQKKPHKNNNNIRFHIHNTQTVFHNPLPYNQILTKKNEGIQ
eukprot:TRINITY_DN44936_c0_g3_i1.p2 TRINITY_DN44936_c0_g3~~TRINITY_DN44936_c0_g3_i1.p2  ORF type:complete len:182 (+),score=13.00 TRINITY_DN44936_c0_g3_i1:116-661(+)